MKESNKIIQYKSKTFFKIALNFAEGFFAIDIYLVRIVGLISQKLFLFTYIQFMKFI